MDARELRIEFKHWQDAKKNRWTTCLLRGPLGTVRADHARCGRRDNFCRETGRKIAFTRAIAGLDRETRRVLWERYHARELRPATVAAAEGATQ